MRTSLEQRFWEKVSKDGPIHPVLLTACWVWTAYINPKDGYGRIAAPGAPPRPLAAHVVSWELANARSREPGKQILHKCDNPRCVRPDHLFEGSPQENMLDMVAKGRCRAPRGEAHGSAVLTDAQVRAIRSSTLPQRETAQTYGVAQSTVSRIRSLEIRRDA
jgi:hypothetical protein